MTHFYKKNTIILLLIILSITSGIAQKEQEDWMFNPKVEFKNKNIFNNFWETARKNIAGSDKIDSTTYFAKADSVLKAYPQDSLTMTELVKVCRGVWDLFTLEDPHFRILPYFIRNAEHKQARKNSFGKHIRCLPFSLLQINDTLIVDNSADKNFLKGDRILSVNGKKAKDLLDYTYRDRYINATMMQMQNHLMFVPNYSIKLIRNGEKMELNTKGTPLNTYNNLLVAKPVATKMLGNIGYIAINKFKYNKFIIKEVRKLVNSVKKIGGNSVIIDLRKNPGGSGEHFDKLLSLFTQKVEIDYDRSVKVMISETTIPDYGYADSIGKLVTLPDDRIFKKVPLHRDLYMGKMNYYLLISKNTGSMAASFANTMQYNNLGKLVGEPMLRNAVRYGEVYDVNNSGVIHLYYSTVENDNYTKAIDGVVNPNIEIPYIADAYMQGGDPILEKLLEIIKSNRNKKVNLEN